MIAPVTERLEHWTPLGLRLRDAATGRVVSDAIEVRVVPQDGSRPLRVFSTPSGVFAARGTPRLLEWETRDAGAEPPAVKPVLVRIEVRDLSGRFHSFSVRDVEMPQPAILHPDWAGPAPDDELQRALPLFSRASRTPPAGMATVRASLLRPDGEPAAFHALEVTPASGVPPVRGIADERGQVVVMFPFPQPAGISGSPPSGKKKPLTEASWKVSLAALRPTTAAPALEPGELPDLRTFLVQSPATLRKGASSTSNELTDEKLMYGQELVLRASATKPELVVRP